MFAAALKLADKYLELAVLKERNKYRDELRELKEEFYEEYNKPVGVRSDAELDHIEHKLRLLIEAICTAVA